METDSEFLSWLADRLVHVYGENPNVDFVHATRRIAAALASPQVAPALTDEQFDAMAVARYTVVSNPDKVFGYGVKVGNGTGFQFRGHRTECEAVAARMRGAFLDGAFVARHPDKCLYDATPAQVAPKD